MSEAPDPAEVRFRPARRQDCRDIARLYRISSDGVADYIWQGLAAPGEDPLDVGERRYARPDSPFSFRNATLAESDGRVIAMLVAFPQPDPEPEPPTAPEDPVLAPYSRLEQPDSYYVCSMAVVDAHRGRGLGTRLLELAAGQARSRDLARLSTICFEENRGALRLYLRHGFREQAREAVVPHPLIRHRGDALLLVKNLA